jgi:hypothetical protein
MLSYHGNILHTSPIQKSPFNMSTLEALEAAGEVEVRQPKKFIAGSRVMWYCHFDCGLVLVAVGPVGPSGAPWLFF